MEKIKTIIITDNQSRGFDLKGKLSDEKIAVVAFADLDELSIQKVESLRPHIVLIIDAIGEKSIKIAQKIYKDLPRCIIFIISKEISVDVLYKAMQAGVRRVLKLDDTAEEINQSIFDCYEFEKTRPSDPNMAFVPCDSKVISVFGGKGGIGKTTLTVNIATALIEKGKKVLILDGNLQMGDVHLFLDLDPKDTLGELIYEKNLTSIEVIKTFTTTHPSGINVLCSPKSPEYAENITPSHLETIINTIRPYYDFILIDLPPSFADTTISLIENSDTIIMVVGVDMSSIRNAKLSINILETLRQHEKIMVVLNREMESIIKTKDIEKVLGLGVSHKIVNDNKTALESLNKGIPIVTMAPRTQIAQQIKALVQALI